MKAGQMVLERRTNDAGLHPHGGVTRRHDPPEKSPAVNHHAAPQRQARHA